MTDRSVLPPCVSRYPEEFQPDWIYLIHTYYIHIKCSWSTGQVLLVVVVKDDDDVADAAAKWSAYRAPQ